MNQEQQNRLSASLFRQTFYMKLLSIEYEFFSKFPLPSGVKNVLMRGKNNFQNCITDLKHHLPNSKEQIDRELKLNDEKLQAIANIVERLVMLDEEDVLKLEKDFEEQIKIQY